MSLFPRAFLRPFTWTSSLRAARTLWFDYAHVRSAALRTAVDASGLPVPWYTYPAIEYLRQLDFSDKTVFEYGSGQSTLFWAAAAKRIVSVEEDESWYARLAPRRPPNCELILETDLADYPGVIDRYPDGFDVIAVDGAARGHTRLKCSRAAIRCLRPGGLVILDNADWLPESARVLRESGLLQVDLTGFAPITGHTQTTTLFFHREFVTRPKYARLPMPGPGASPKNWEQHVTPEPPVVVIGDDTLSGVRTDRAVVFDAPEGLRRFRLLTGVARGTEWAALTDDDRQRVLLFLAQPSDDPKEIERHLADGAGSWDGFRAYIAAHERRRYRL